MPGRVPDQGMGRSTRGRRIHEALAEGVRLYNLGHFFECHEVLEEVWLQEEGGDKDFLQGIIKAAAAFHHYQKGTYQGMRNLLRAARGTLRPFAPERHGVELAEFLRGLEAWIPRAQRLLAGASVPDGVAVPPLVYREEACARC